MFIYFCPIGKSDRVSGGHEVKFGDKTLHIENYTELKNILRDKHTDWDEDTVHAEADKILNEIIANMDKKLEYHQKAAFIDEEIMKKIESIRKGNSE
jgi:hypothetical protein